MSKTSNAFFFLFICFIEFKCTLKNVNVSLYQLIWTFSYSYFWLIQKRKQFYAKVACQHFFFSIVRYLILKGWLYLNLCHGVSHLALFQPTTCPVRLSFSPLSLFSVASFSRTTGPLNQPRELTHLFSTLPEGQQLRKNENMWIKIINLLISALKMLSQDIYWSLKVEFAIFDQGQSIIQTLKLHKSLV